MGNNSGGGLSHITRGEQFNMLVEKVPDNLIIFPTLFSVLSNLELIENLLDLSKSDCEDLEVVTEVSE